MADKKWQKLLHCDQGVPDNYVDESFLDELRKNVNVRTYDYLTVCYNSGAIVQQISSVALFVVIYWFMSTGDLSPYAVIVSEVFTLIIFYFIHSLISRCLDGVQISLSDLRQTLRTAILSTTYIFILSPVLATLTHTISTDTIYTMTVLMLMVSLLFHDYFACSALVASPVSLTSAVFASVCLASRLPDSSHTFAMTTLALQVFALFPPLRQQVERISPACYVATTIVLSCVTLVTLSWISEVAALLGGLLVVFATFVCPWWLTRLQPLKNNIQGPWDEAVVHYPPTNN